MRYAGLKLNDATNCDQGIVVSFWCQGCPHRCEGCHNPETWSYDGGLELPTDIKGQIVKAISANGVQRNFSVLGGEPLCPENAKIVLEILNSIRTAYPKIKIFLWTGYTAKDLFNSTDTTISSILDKIDILIDGKFEKKNKDFSLVLRGSSNQNIWEKDQSGKWENQTKKYDSCKF